MNSARAPVSSITSSTVNRELVTDQLCLSGGVHELPDSPVTEGLAKFPGGSRNGRTSSRWSRSTVREPVDVDRL